MKAIILAAGEGIRMRPLTLEKPKPLLTIEGQSLLYHLVSAFPKEIKEIVLVVGYLGNQIINHCGDKFLGRPVKYVWQKESKGTYYALELCKPLLEKNERFCLFYADDLIDKSTIQNCLNHELSVSTKKVSNPKRFGIITLNADGSLNNITEKPENPPSDLAVASIYVLNKNILDYPPDQHPNGEYYLPTSISKMAKEHKIIPVQASLWLPVATPEDLKKAEKLFSR